jgi:DNA-binding transcriptional LysR family regulator
MWRDVELRELRIFLMLAEELHFGRTAERLGISQPGVSGAMRALESRLGVKVFDRTSRRVRLTPAGEALERSLVPALAAVDRALAETSELSRAVRGLLRVGFVLTTEGPALSRLTAIFQARYPACEVRLQEVETFDAYRALRRGDIDVLCNWLAVDEPDLTAGTAFAHYQRALAVAATHRLAGQHTVSIEDLAGEEVALFPPTTPPAVYDLIVPPRTPSGRPIRRTHPVQTINEILSLVARGRIVHPTSPTVPIFNRNDVALVPIDDLPPPPTRAGLVHQPREPAHPRPQRNRQFHDHRTRHRTCCPAPRHDRLKLRLPPHRMMGLAGVAPATSASMAALPSPGTNPGDLVFARRAVRRLCLAE